MLSTYLRKIIVNSGFNSDTIVMLRLNSVVYIKHTFCMFIRMKCDYIKHVRHCFKVDVLHTVLHCIVYCYYTIVLISNYLYTK